MTTQTERLRSPLIGRVGLCVAIVGVALFVAALLAEEMDVLPAVFEESAWAARVFSVPIVVAAVGGGLSLIGCLQARREGLQRDVALAGMIVGLGPAALVTGGILLFFIETMLWGT